MYIAMLYLTLLSQYTHYNPLWRADKGIMLIRESAWLRESLNTKTHCLQPQLGIYYKTTLIRMVHSGLGNRTDRQFKTQGGAIQGFWFTVALKLGYSFGKIQ